MRCSSCGAWILEHLEHNFHRWQGAKRCLGVGASLCVCLCLRHVKFYLFIECFSFFWVVFLFFALLCLFFGIFFFFSFFDVNLAIVVVVVIVVVVGQTGSLFWYCCWSVLLFIGAHMHLHLIDWILQKLKDKTKQGGLSTWPAFCRDRNSDMCGICVYLCAFYPCICAHLCAGLWGLMVLSRRLFRHVNFDLMLFK